jgi:PAS domain S-box-containing protein
LRSTEVIILINFNPQPTWLLNANSLQILSANIAAQKKYGFSLDDFIKMSFIQLHPKEEEQLIKYKFTSKEEKIFKNNFTHLLSDGQEIKVDVHFKEIEIFSTSALIVQSNDISETLKYINTIEIQNTKLKDISWTQSHVVRAPLARMLGIINLFEEGAVNDDELLFCLKQLKNSCNEMDDIIKNIVDRTKDIELN